MEVQLKKSTKRTGMNKYFIMNDKDKTKRVVSYNKASLFSIDLFIPSFFTFLLEECNLHSSQLA